MTFLASSRFVGSLLNIPWTSYLVSFLVQLLGDEALPVLQPIVEKLLQGDDKNKQRGAAEFMAGIIGGESTIVMELYNH